MGGRVGGDTSRLPCGSRPSACELREGSRALRCRAMSSRRSITSACSSATSRLGVEADRLGAEDGRAERSLRLPSSLRHRASSSCCLRSAVGNDSAIEHTRMTKCASG